MINLFKKIRVNEKGTALLVALLVMGVLISISLALSALILGEARSTRELIDAGKAYYAAESGIENALYYIDSRLPGWEGKENNLGEVGEGAAFSYVVKNKCNSYPCIEADEYEIGSNPSDAYYYYDVLELNESITVPLFTVDDEGNVVAAQAFTVEFFTKFNPKTDLKFQGAAALSGWDVLRWKLFGLKVADDGSYQTEALHDFTAVSAAKNSETGESFSTNASHPSWFGSRACGDLEGNPDPVTGISCEGYTDPVAGPEDGAICNNTQARNYYFYLGDEFIAKKECFSIDEFMIMHQVNSSDGGTGLNYLSLTNLMNPDMLVYDNIDLRMEASKIYFRVETYEYEIPREFAKITSDGYSGNAKQSIDVQIKKDSYMPVFNFSIYSTYVEGNNPDKYYAETGTKEEPVLPGG